MLVPKFKWAAAEDFKSDDDYVGWYWSLYRVMLKYI